MLCKEGELARHARLAAPARRKFAADLDKAPLVWRHCPFGVHDLLGAARPYVYVTMLRLPFARMASWFAYCTTYSKDKCHTAPYKQRDAAESKMLAFYGARRRKYDAFPPAKVEAARAAPVAKLATFHPNWIEYALDDNYATRMVAGGPMHDHPVPLPAAALDAARDHLRTQYAFVGTLERQAESLCVLGALVGAPVAKVQGDKHRGPTTHTKSKDHPADFLAKFADYARLDAELYKEADALLEAHVADAFPQCRRGGGP